MGRHTTAHLYAVPVLAALDAIRKCAHCRRNPDDNCKAWREARESVAYFAPDAPDFLEAGELKGHAPAAAQQILNESGVSGGNPVRLV